jgi:hypothetical protein
MCAHPGSSRSLGYGLACGALVPHLIELPCNAFISTSVALASHPICDILATNVGIVRKSGVPEADSRQCEGGGSIIDICHATVRWWEAALHDPCFVTFDFGWGPPGSGARGLIAMEQKTGVDQSRLR